MAGRILIYSCQLNCLLLCLFGTVLSFQRSSNLARVFVHQGYNLAACYTLLQWCKIFQPMSLRTIFSGTFQLGIFLHCIFIISWLISTFSILFTFSNCFLKLFNHTACWLCSFLILRYHSKIWYCLFISLDLCTPVFWMTWNSSFCPNCEILCSYLQTHSLTFYPFYIIVCMCVYINTCIHYICY